jgi:transcriptional regulator with XRE-family HTH domain
LSLGQRLKLQRKRNKLTQKDVARILKINYTTISKWETNVYDPDTDSLRKLAELYGTTVDYLIGLSNNQRAPEIKSLTSCLILSNGKIEELSDEETEFLKESLESFRKWRS